MSNRGSDGGGGQVNQVNYFGDRTDLTDQISPFHLQRGQNSMSNSYGVGTFFFTLAGGIPVHPHIISVLRKIHSVFIGHSGLEGNCLTLLLFAAPE